MQTQTNEKKSTKPAAAPNATRAAQVAAEPTKAVKAKPEPKVDPVLAMKVTIATEGKANPKKVGSKSFARFALYKDGMTVASYLEASVAAGQDRKAARADLKWDTDHKYITLA